MEVVEARLWLLTVLLPLKSKNHCLRYVLFYGYLVGEPRQQLVEK
jgi:hypothetical protein